LKFPYAEVELESDGSVHDPNQVRAALSVVDKADDVLILVHGWNSDIPAAKRLYERLTDSIDAVRGRVPATVHRKIAVVGILWPSIEWADAAAVAGGGASAASAQQALITEIGTRELDPTVAAELQQLVPELHTKTARKKYLDLLRSQLPGADDDSEDAPPPSLLVGDADTVFDDAGHVGGLTGHPMAGGGAAGVSVRDFIREGRNLLNLTTYYTMRDRAGRVGATGIASLIDKLDGEGRRIHLVGHSFGARAASAAANASTSPVHALVLLQGAFSHFGFARDWNGAGADGLFRAVPSRIQGPTVVTHTKNDRDVGFGYAVASRVARHVAVGIGGPTDRYGGIGRNGALKTPEALAPGVLQPVGSLYTFQRQKLSNLEATAFIKRHTDVTGEQVAYALLTAVST
jgi:hypothetical protein